MVVDLKAAAERLQEVTSLEELVSVLMDADVQALMAQPTQGPAWKNWMEQRKAELAAAQAAAPTEEEIAPPPSTQQPTPTGPGILGKKASTPTATAATAARPETAVGILQLVERSAHQQEEWETKSQEAYERLTDGLGEQHLIIPRGMEYQVPPGDRVTKAITFLRNEIANGRMTVGEAIEFAREKDWLVEVEVDPRIIRQVEEKVEAQGFELFSSRLVGEDKIYPATELGRAVETGEIKIDEVFQLAQKAGWIRPFRPAEETSLEERLGPEKARELREASGRGRDRGRRRKSK